MKFDNMWLNKSQQEVTVHLKRRVFKYDKDGVIKESLDTITGKKEVLGYHEHFVDLDDTPKSMIVKVQRHGLSLAEKLSIVHLAALARFNTDINEWATERYAKTVYHTPQPTEAPIVIDSKFFVGMPTDWLTPLNHASVFKHMTAEEAEAACRRKEDK